MTERLAGKVALIHGGSAGIGLAIARRFTVEGARVAIADIRPPRDGSRPDPCLWLACDIADGAAVAEVTRTVAEHFGALHVMVDAAAAMTPIAPVTELPETAWTDAIAVNLTGAYHAARAAIPPMAEAGGGSIVLIASEIGMVGSRGRSAYGATKAALIQLVRVLALDHAAQGIRAKALSPGAVVTDRLLARFGTREAAEAALSRLYPLGRLGTPEEMAAAALFLASDESAFMTGANLVVDGGYTAQ